MIRLSLASFLGLLAAALVAWRLGGREGAGIVSGYLLGAGFTGLGVLYQRHVILTSPERSMQAFTVSFLAKLVALLIGALSFRYIEAAAARADWRSFLLAFAAAVSVILPLGLIDVLQALRRRGAPTNMAARGEARG